MPYSFLSKKIVISIVGIVLLAVLIFFRDDVSRFLSFGPEPSPTSQQSTSTPQGEGTSREVEGPPAETIPPYTGRDPKEVRPDPEEVKNLSTAQREKTYADLKNVGEQVSLFPDYFFGWIQVGLLKKIIGDFIGARDAWEYASTIRPQNSLSFANLGELYWHYLPDFPRSEKNFLISIKNKPDDTSVYMSLSDLYSYSYTAKKDQADDILLKGIAANPGDIDLMKWLAALYEREKNYVSALEWWKKVLEKAPTDAVVKERIEALEVKAGQ